MACATCHAGPKFNFQFSVWRRSKHAQAYATLATPAARIAREAGVTGDPKKTIAASNATSPARLRRQRVHGGLRPRDGVQCEACHGPGSGYSPEAIMLDLPAARANGLLEVTAATCLPCHEQAHGKAFDLRDGREKDRPSHPATPLTVHEPTYKNPLNLALTPNGQELWVACEASASVIVVDTATPDRHR
jgi:hypothetical protein